jgi:hypothetical protein
MVMMKEWKSDGLVLYGFFLIDDSFFIENTIAAIGAFDGVIGSHFAILAALLVDY